MDYQKHFKFILILFYVALGIVVCYFFITKIAAWIMPFLLALVLAYLIEPGVKFARNKLKINRKIGSAIFIILALIVISGIATLIVGRIVNEIKGLGEQLPGLFKEITSNLVLLINRLNEITFFGYRVNIEVSELSNMIVTQITPFLTSQISPTLKNVSHFATSIPGGIISVVVFLISSYFISSDKEIILEFIKQRIPASWTVKATEMKEYMLSALFKYLKAQLILMTITAVELFIGFSVLQMKYSLLLALTISIIDAFPILGTGTILIPWAAFSLLLGDIRNGVSLLIIYGVCLTVRQLIEPKIVSKQIGLHPLITLFGMYLGLQLLGFSGMIIFPVCFLILKNLHDKKSIKLWN